MMSDRKILLKAAYDAEYQKYMEMSAIQQRRLNYPGKIMKVVTGLNDALLPAGPFAIVFISMPIGLVLMFITWLTMKWVDWRGLSVDKQHDKLNEAREAWVNG